MRYAVLLASSALLATLPAAANAACTPEFVDSSETVNVDGAEIGPREISRETFQVRVRNVGDGGNCPATIRIVRVSPSPAGTTPGYTLRSGGTEIEILPFEGTASSVNSDVLVPNAPSGPNGRSVPFQLLVPTPWGLRAGNYIEQLRFELRDGTNSVVDTLNVTLNINIPRVASVRVVGATGTDDISRINLGTLNSTDTNVSDPFGVRIWSTSAYAVTFQSANNGNLVHENGRDRIPYAMTIDGQPVDLAAGAAQYLYNEYTNSLGVLHPLVVRAGPVVARAGYYSDRVVVTVSPV